MVRGDMHVEVSLEVGFSSSSSPFERIIVQFYSSLNKCWTAFPPICGHADRGCHCANNFQVIAMGNRQQVSPYPPFFFLREIDGTCGGYPCSHRGNIGADRQP